MVGSDASNLFYMNESIPGWVYTKASLDYEKKASYKLTVLAFDHGEPKKEASLEYVIEVDDENEFAPVFKETGGYSFQMYGDLEVGSFIGNVSSLYFLIIDIFSMHVYLTLCDELCYLQRSHTLV